MIGRVFGKQTSPTRNAIDYVPAYIVHDDQAGPYLWLPKDGRASVEFGLESQDLVRHTVNGQLEELNLADNGSLAIVLMHKRVFSTAREAEYTASNRIGAVLDAMSTVRTALSKKRRSVHDRLMDELELASQNKTIVLCTYLTSASEYRRHIARGTASDELKNALLGLHLPHFTWITEISTVDSYNQSSPGMRRIYGHTVLDATSTGRDKSGLLMLHLPGLVLANDVDAAPGGRGTRDTYQRR